MIKRLFFLSALSVFCGGCFGFWTDFVKAQDFNYVWPIEKSYQLSSLFADYRGFHFHSGIDIRTGGTTGYKVFACEDGYVHRLFTSYWGYGKAVYLKLDDGRYAVYGHLSNFAQKLSPVVQKEQLEKKRYLVDLFLKKDELRVKKGELIGYSGQSGSGGPHLHFEIRDRNERPINPLTLGFSIPDELPPVIKYLAIRPLEVRSKVNGSHLPLIFSCRHDPRKKIYTLENMPMVEGKVGLELSLFDKIDDSRFKFGVHKIELFLDGNLIFASHYDTISYDQTHKIELDRDFELKKKEKKEFYKLYADEGNDLPLYNPNEGMIEAKSSEPDSHQVKIIADDASGNSSTLIFHLLYDQSPKINSCRIEEGEEDLKIKTEFNDPDDMVKKIIFEKTSPGKILWQKFSQAEFDKPESRYTLTLAKNLSEPILVRIRVEDSFGASSHHKHLLLNVNKAQTLKSPQAKDKTLLNFEYSFKDNFFVFDLNFPRMLKREPQIKLGFGKSDLKAQNSWFDPLFLEQKDQKSYWVVFPFHGAEEKQMTLLVNGQDIYDDSVRFKQVIPISIVTRSSGGKATSEDKMAEVKIDPKIVYEDINLSIRKENKNTGSKHKMVGEVYSFEPSTVPLNGFAKISLKYIEGDCVPRRLGLYELSSRGWWKLTGQDLDVTNKTISGKVRYFSTYVLLEDTTPPSIKQVYPSTGAKLKNKKPKIKAMVKDDLSGIGSDLDVLITIDGEWMIPEYDPETAVLFAIPTLPLSYGKHQLLISVKDKAGNKNEVRRNFFVIK